MPMKEKLLSNHSRILPKQKISELYDDVLATALYERSKAVTAHLVEIEVFIKKGIQMIQDFERSATMAPSVRSDIDIVYIDSGPGPIAINLLKQKNRYNFPDKNYHKFPWSGNMDKDRIEAGIKFLSHITARRKKEATNIVTLAKHLTTTDYLQYAPYLMYTSTDWQTAHARDAITMFRKSGRLKIPDDKIIMYDSFKNRKGDMKPIIHTEDQIEGLTFPKCRDGRPPRRVAIVSHPAHLMRIMHILGHYPERIPETTIVQPVPILTPIEAVIEYARAELLGTIATVISKNRATLIPYDRYQLM
jgi:hypothetical protein